VFAVVGQLGTEPVQAARSYLNEQKVPQTLVATGASYWGTQYKQFPWTIGFQPDYIAEGRLYGLHIKANQRGKKIAVLYQNDDYGKDYLYGLRSALGKSRGRKHRAEEAVTAGTTSVRVADGEDQGKAVRRSSSSFDAPGLTIRRATGKALHNPDQIYLNPVLRPRRSSTSQRSVRVPITSTGLITIATLRSVDPAQNGDAALQEYRRIMAKYAPSANASNQLYVYGFALADTFVQAMYKAGKNPTRAGYMNALLSLNTTNRFALNGVRLKTSKTDHFVISQMRLQRFSSPIWSPIGPPSRGARVALSRELRGCKWGRRRPLLVVGVQGSSP
jgi:branched-chain amino acid transport system substrate-binding protein